MRIHQDMIDFQHHAKLGSDVWIGANAIINRGITVGDGAVIGAGSCSS